MATGCATSTGSSISFPEFTRYVRDLGSELATALLRDYPTAAALHGVRLRRLAGLRYDGRTRSVTNSPPRCSRPGACSVGRHHGEAYRIQVRYTCEDIALLRRRLRDLERDIERLLDDQQVGRLRTTIEGIGSQTSARLVGTFRRLHRLPKRGDGRFRRRHPGDAAVWQANIDESWTC